ncbi:MAG: hypothetical protein IJD02_05210 [Lachnospiraceae bacterium]|nr:hypothetical protein [Lachnospiraceae bacterium]
MQKVGTMTSKQLEILKKASPHLMPRPSSCINALLMVNELSETIRNIRNPNELSTCDTKGFSSNPEDMLVSIKSVCSPRECEIIDMITNLRKSKDLYNTYKMISPEMFKG